MTELDDLQAAHDAVRQDSGHEEAFLAAYRAWIASSWVWKRVTAIATKIVGRRWPAESDDVSQQVLERLLQKRASVLIQVQNWERWLGPVARRAVVDEYRRLVRRRNREELADVDGVDSQDELIDWGRPDAELLARQRARCFEHCLDQLNRRATQRRRARAFEVWDELRDEAPDNATICAVFNQRNGETLKVNAFERLVSHAKLSLATCIQECERGAAA